MVVAGVILSAVRIEAHIESADSPADVKVCVSLNRVDDMAWREGAASTQRGMREREKTTDE